MIKSERESPVEFVLEDEHQQQKLGTVTNLQIDPLWRLLSDVDSEDAGPDTGSDEPDDNGSVTETFSLRPLSGDELNSGSPDAVMVEEFLDTDSGSASESERTKPCQSARKRSRTKARCDVCGKFVLNRAEHYRMHHGIRAQKCPYCAQTFVHRSNLYVHMNIHTRERSYICGECNNEFSSIHGLKQHELMHREKQFECRLCGNKYSRKSYLRIHRQRVHEEHPKFNCTVCDRSFASVAMRDKHTKIHDNAGQYCCVVCQRVYTMKKNLIRHTRVSHPAPGTLTQDRAEMAD